MGPGQNETFLKYCQNAYQIEGNDACNNIVANILRTDTPLIPGLESKRQNIFSSEKRHVAYQFKGNGAPLKQIFFPYTYLQPMECVKRTNIELFRNMVMLHNLS